MALVTIGLPLLAVVPPFSFFQKQDVWLSGFSNAGVFVLLALGLNIVVGLAGLLDLGYAAFFAIGAYVYAYGSSPYSGLHLPFLVMLAIAPLVAATFGVLLGAPTLRLRGDYLAIVTLGFGEIVPIVFLNAEKFTEGTNGIGGIYKPDLPFVEFTLLNPWPFYLLMAVILTITMILIYRLQDSRIGRSWMAIREDELAAAASGLNTVTTKLLAFALGASTAGLAGVFNASKLTLVSPDQFLSTVSFSILAMIVLGGMGNIWGVALGAFIVYTIQVVFLKQLNAFFAALQVPDPQGPELRPVPAPALRPGAGADDAVPARGPLPLQTTQAGAPCRRRPRRDGADRRAGARRQRARPMTAASPEDATLLEAEHITKRFGGLLAINDISFVSRAARS